MSVKLIWYGHATIGVETAGFKLLIDPYFTGNPAASTTADKIETDYILLSHGHFDHVGDVVSIAIRTGATVITNHEISNWLENQGIQTHGQHIGGGYRHPFGYLKFTLALHGSGLPDGSDGGNPVGFLLTTLDGKNYYFSCDTGLFSDMRLIGETGLDLAVLPIGDNFTMGPDDALRAVKLLQPKHVIPTHYDTWDLIRQDAGAWSKRAQAETGVQVHVLKPSMSITL